jgi:alpha-amylase
MKRLSIILIPLIIPVLMMAQGWPANYKGVMLQGFYWDSYDDTQWTKLESQADELSQYFSLVWVPQSAYCGGKSMGYDDLYWFSNYNSSFGNKAQLTAMIKTFKDKGIGTIADVVINHRKELSNWVNFPAEEYNGTVYQLKSTDVVANDDVGKTKTWATTNGYQLSSYNDSGDGWDGMRDLDHYSQNVQTNVKAYLKMLLDDLGYAGFRYDMVKGYASGFTGMYNSYAAPTYSVGEYWDSNVNAVKTWLNGTKTGNEIQSAAFDFPFRYTVRDAINNNNWTKLANSSLISDEAYKRYAVTFVENHDTEYRSASEQQDPIRKDTLAANAYLLAMPGTPCVFLKHWQKNKAAIKSMIEVRNMTGIHSQSMVYNMSNLYNLYAASVTGSDGKLLVAVGPNAAAYAPGSQWVKVLSGNKYAYFVENTINRPWVDLASGSYPNAQRVTLTAISDNSAAKLVYTTDGTTPTASSKQAGSGTTLDIPEGTTVLKVGLLIGNTVSNIITRNYTVRTFVPYTITVHVNTSAVNWSGINFWTWGGDGSHGPNKTSWPGDAVTSTKTAEGKTWYYKNFTINSEDDYVNFVFSTGSGTPQTEDYSNVNTDSYFEISTLKNANGHHIINNVTEQITASVGGIAASTETGIQRVYRTDGRLVRVVEGSVEQALNGLGSGLYIVNKKKYVK